MTWDKLLQSPNVSFFLYNTGHAPWSVEMIHGNNAGVVGLKLVVVTRMWLFYFNYFIDSTSLRFIIRKIKSLSLLRSPATLFCLASFVASLSKSNLSQCLLSMVGKLHGRKKSRKGKNASDNIWKYHPPTYMALCLAYEKHSIHLSNYFILSKSWNWSTQV